MDPSNSGYILWEEFLAYIRWQESVFGILHGDQYAQEDNEEAKQMVSHGRRMSIQAQLTLSRHQVRARLELRHVFDSLVDQSLYHRVSCKELQLAIRFSPKCRELFQISLLAKRLPDDVYPHGEKISYQEDAHQVLLGRIE